jgi:hypothetical protein
MTNTSQQFHLTKEQLFKYFGDLEKYPERYPKYCTRVDIIKKSDNETITSEFWNIESPKEGVAAQIRYSLNPPIEFNYEIIDGEKVGPKNKMIFSDTNVAPFKSNAEFSLPVLDITGRICGNKSVVYQELHLYI